MHNDPDEIKKRHDGGYLTLFKIYQSDEKFHKDPFFKLSVIISLILTGIACFSNNSIYDIILRLLDASIGILPSLLGFNLGAYILIVGFGATDILSVITKPLKGQKNFSLYQKLNGIMGVSVLIQIATLSFIFILKIWDKIQEGFSFTFEWVHLNQLIAIVNTFIFFIVFSFVIYCFLILLNVVKQVFLFAQTIHFIIYTEQQKKTEEKAKEN